jgi:hypothetical protein
LRWSFDLAEKVLLIFELSRSSRTKKKEKPSDRFANDQEDTGLMVGGRNILIGVEKFYMVVVDSFKGSVR